MGFEGQIITINVSGPAGVGKSTIAYLLADFLSNTGFNTELNLTEEFDLESFEETFVDKLGILETRGTKMIINEVITKRSPKED